MTSGRPSVWEMAAAKLESTAFTARDAASPGQLAQILDPRTVQTPALDLIDSRLVEVAEGSGQRLILSMPPQEGKSQRVSHYFPTWMLMRDQGLRIGIASYEQGIARRWGRAVRNTINSHPELGLRVRNDTSAAHEWQLDGSDGGLYSVGLGGALTGRPLDCVAGDTYILTDHGAITAADAFERGITRILSYDHGTSRAVWRSVEATRRIDERRVVTVRTESGRTITCTPDHRIYTSRGYLPAGSLRRGDALVALVVDPQMSVRQPARHPEDGSSKSDPSGAGTLLHQGVHGEGVHRSPSDPLLQMRCVHPLESESGLLGRMPAPTPHLAPADMRSMRDTLPATHLAHPVLHSGLREQSALSADDRPRQLPLQNGGQLRTVVSVDASADTATRQPSVRRLRRESHHPVHARVETSDPVGVGHSPHRRERDGQPTGESNSALLQLPRDASQVEPDTVAMVFYGSDETVSVYDFQVAGTRNFFANGVLVHNCLLIDDPVKDRAQAESLAYRDAAWNWWTDVARTRFAPEAWCVLIMCMTGDTPVLMGDGTEKSLRDVRPGDTVATYENGGVTTATVRNWVNQGPDSIYSIKMKSGTVVKANARHPFLVAEDGVESWRQLQALKVGDAIVRVTPPEAACSELSAPSATSPRSARACACTTTAKPDGRLATDRLRSILNHVGRHTSSTVMASMRQSMTDYLRSKVVPALSAVRLQVEDGQSRIISNSASITTTTLAECAACCATVATSLSDTRGRQLSYSQPLNTYTVGLDEVVEIVPCGTEDVYDIQVDRTENFIANGLAAHNTRWHEDDLAGRLIEQDLEDWQVVNIPALADHRPERGEVDPLGREPGQWMESARGRTMEQWQKIREAVGERTFAALYQGRPAPAEGVLLKRQLWQRYDAPKAIRQPDGTMLALGADEVLQSWDMAFKDTKASDYVVGQVWGRWGNDAYLLDQVHDRLSFTATVDAVRRVTKEWPQTRLKLVEDKANGTAVIDHLRREITGLVPVQVKDGKYARAVAVSPFIESRHVFLPADTLATWAQALIDESAAFPNSQHDDQVDAMTQALDRLLGHPVKVSIRRPPQQLNLPSGVGAAMGGQMLGNRYR